jgi:hypothetical protein
MVTDQDKIPRFANGDPVHPLGKPEPPWRTLGVIFGTWALVIAVLIGAFWLMFALVAERRAHADETAARIFEVDGECYIDTDLRVTGNKRAACVNKLDTATRLSKMEMRVNEHRKR